MRAEPVGRSCVKSADDVKTRVASSPEALLEETGLAGASLDETMAAN